MGCWKSELGKWGFEGGFTPLCPAGHLPRKGEIDLRHGLAHLNVQNELTKERLADLPLVGEMPGRAEG
ncbi:lytic murein transglycosylase [Rhizobium sp. NIBRBAC000502774]|nr:lytic murein transglycosylase [Rhizobium sp. NIBRBAC000502774]